MIFLGILTFDLIGSNQNFLYVWRKKNSNYRGTGSLGQALSERLLKLGVNSIWIPYKWIYEIIFLVIYIKNEFYLPIFLE